MSGIKKTDVILDVVNMHPEAADILTSYGFHCVGCGVSEVETIEEGAQGHGMTNEEINKVVKEINKAISRKTEKKGKNSAEGIAVTAAAVERLRELLKKEQKKDCALRLEVRPGGCAGFSYAFSFTKEKNENDVAFDYDGVKIVIDKSSYNFIKGSEIDYVDGLQGAGFKVNNPNAKATCGCGKSFS